MTTDTAQPPLDTKPHGLADQYVPAVPALDEMTEADGSLRNHWRPFVSMLDNLGHDEVHARWDQARRLIRDNGITHNIYGDPEGVARPWKLDLLPLLLPEKQWQTVGEGLQQRARLLNALLADLYGAATSVTSGILPSDLIYANSHFLRPCHGTTPPGNTWLHLYAADLVRTSDGKFHVLSDRTQAPSGAGYSLENRIVLSRVLPTVFTQCNVQRLAPFFIAVRQMLASLAPAHRENPRVVLLTPGPYNETYFEHAYLARYLGYTLVQGKDLTVRDGKVFLKTLSGLQRVDVILRRVDDDFCDPLELYPHSYLGVSGLLQAVREGNVAIANALGSGVIQGPGFMPFLPKLCKHLLGEELKLDSVQTWWCGNTDSRRYVLENLSKLVIKPALPTVGTDPMFGGSLSKAELEELAGKIAGSPREYVAQEQVCSYTAPVFHGRAMQSRRFVVRAYLVSTADGYSVMPGALTRVTSSSETLVVSLQKGGGSKDTWIQSDAPVSQVSLLRPTTLPLALNRTGSDLPSRVADDLFWLGRYVERADSIARLARCVFNRLSDPNSIENPRAIGVLAGAMLGWPMPLPAGPFTAKQMAVEMFAESDPSWLRSSASNFHSLARVLRDRISTDAWRILQSIYRDLSEFKGDISDDGVNVVIELLNKLVTGFLAFGGMAAESMTRGQAWRFLDIGMRVERGIAASRLIRASLVVSLPEEPALLDAVLETADSSLTYRRRYLTRVETAAVVDLLVADESNPRAVAFQVRAIEEHLASLPRESTHPRSSPDLQLAVQLRTRLRLEDLVTACKVVDGRRDKLHAVVNDTVGQLSSMSDFVAQIFFSHAVVTPRLLSPDQEAAP